MPFGGFKSKLNSSILLCKYLTYNDLMIYFE